MSFSEFETTIRDLVIKDELQKAITCLSAQLREDEQQENITLLSARYHSIQHDYANGVIDYEDFQKTMNQLRINILAFAKKGNKPPQESVPSIEKEYRISLARIGILHILYQENNKSLALNVTQIQAQSGIKNRKHIVDSIYEMENYHLVSKYKIGKITCWKLTEKGLALAQEFADSLLFRAEK